MTKYPDFLFYSIIPAVILLHLLAAPYTKVEESFHIQAAHDILTYGIPSPLHLDSAAIAAEFQSNYDHFSFPGAVPRTFVGALGLASASWPIVWLNENIDRQFLGMSPSNEKPLFIISNLQKRNSSASYSRSLQCFVLVFICARIAEVFWQCDGVLVSDIPGQPVSYCLLCIANVVKYVCPWSEYVCRLNVLLDIDQV